MTAGTNIRCFKPLSFYFGCIYDAEQGVVNAATECTITVSAYKSTSETPSAVTTFTFPQPVRNPYVGMS